MSDKKRSAVWQHFEMVEVNGRRKTKCNICNFELAYNGGTSAMQNHLKKHPASVEPKKSQASDTSSKQQTLKQVMGARSGIKMTERYQLLVRRIAEMCALDFRPLSIVNGEGFQSLVGNLDPNFKVPCHTTVKNLHKIYCEKKEEMMKAVSSQSGVALRTDLWTSAPTGGYITLTSHYIDENWELRSQVLATRTMLERHTGKKYCRRNQNKRRVPVNGHCVS